tara:strand:+ start:227 stop:2713 length:2487 start_codon:yes stop_codon:yes gene_type:complete
MVFGNQLMSQKALSKSHNKKYQKSPLKQKGIAIMPVDPIICYGNNDYHPHYVPPKIKGSFNKSKRPIQFDASYTEVTPQEVRDIFEDFIFPTLSESFSSTIPVRLTINWVPQSGTTLASAGPTSISRLLAFPLQDTWYPIALAEKLIDRNLNGESPDIVVNINSQVNWYLDWNNPDAIGSRQDLASTILHEVYHGMGFVTGSTVDDDGLGFLLQSGSPYIYSRQMENANGSSLLDFDEGSSRLGGQLTSNNVFFNSENLTGIDRAKLYAPTSYAPTSSISHLDEILYSSSENSLMTPTSSLGEVERSAGIAETMMKDMGWVYTSIIHTPEEPRESLTEPLLVEAYIVSDEDVDESSLTLTYFEEGSSTPIELNMTKGGDGIFSTTIPATGEERFVLYYLSVNDVNGKNFTNPGQAPNELLYRFNFAIDDTSPEIMHDPVTSISSSDMSFDLIADVSDEFVGVESVIVETSINKGAIFTTETRFEPANEFTDSLYLATVELPMPLTSDDILEYRIVAVDKAMAKNRSTNPASGFHRIEINDLASTVNFYFADFSENADDFFSDGFEILTPSGFSDPAVHSLHPYLNAGDASFINYTYQLKNPVLINADDPTIKFDEIVLVENGEPGVPFGTTEFWDYVIVEGQRIGERDWLPFLEGYDCSANALWRSTYINGIPTNEQDSQGAGTSQMFRPREIDMTSNENFAPGDVISIRFRLFSDPFAVGWGWAIDNLRIQASTVAVNDYVEEKNSFVVYPNPVQDEMYLGINLKQNAPNSQITITDIYGKVIHNQRIDLNADYNEETINTSNLPKGMYLVSVRFNNEDIITKKVIK